MRRSLPVLAVGALTAATLLFPGTASAKTHSYWSTAHQTSRTHTRIVDPGNGITWTIKDHQVMVTTPDVVVVPFVYTCGSKADPKGVKYDPGAFQTVFNAPGAAAFTDEDTADYPTFTCDGTQHTTDVVLTGTEDSFDFANGNVEIGLVGADDDSVDPTFEHAVVGYDQLHDTRVSVSVTVNATPESTEPGAEITVKGTVKRGRKAYKNKTATLYFQSKAGDPAVKAGTAVVNSKGNLKTKVSVTGPGSYFWITGSTSKTQAGASLGDYAAAA